MAHEKYCLAMIQRIKSQNERIQDFIYKWMKEYFKKYAARKKSSLISSRPLKRG